jgi:hypothetical protein
VSAPGRVSVAGALCVDGLILANTAEKGNRLFKVAFRFDKSRTDF